VLVPASGPLPASLPGSRRVDASGRASLWTDDFSNLLEALK
jgi:hypothetical protein